MNLVLADDRCVCSDCLTCHEYTGRWKELANPTTNVLPFNQDRAGGEGLGWVNGAAAKAALRRKKKAKSLKATKAGFQELAQTSEKADHGYNHKLDPATFPRGRMEHYGAPLAV